MAEMTENKLEVPLIYQEQDCWCWAASAKMVLTFYGITGDKQCEMANDQFGQTNCCADPTSEDCNQGICVKDIVPLFQKYGLNSKRRNYPVSFNKLKDEIDAGRPVEVRIRWDGGGGHAVIVHGYRDDDEGQFLSVNDPWVTGWGTSEIEYDHLKEANGDGGTWANTWVAIQ